MGYEDKCQRCPYLTRSCSTAKRYGIKPELEKPKLILINSGFSGLPKRLEVRSSGIERKV